MTRLSPLLLAVPALLVASPALAGEDTQYWQSLGVTVNLGGNFSLSDELVVRSGDARGLYEIENAILLGYKPVKNVTVAAGYVHNPTYSHSNFVVMEHRLRQQVTVDNLARLGPARVSARLRLEQRWRDGGVTGTAWRLRPYLKASMPFIGKTSLNLSHESFVNLTTTTFQKVDGYDRMRNAVTVAVPVNKAIKIEAGYLNQLGIVRGGPDNMDHVATIGLSGSF